jgi:hypothetical protein
VLICSFGADDCLGIRQGCDSQMTLRHVARDIFSLEAATAEASSCAVMHNARARNKALRDAINKITSRCLHGESL